MASFNGQPYLKSNEKDFVSKDGHALKKTSFGSGRAHESEDDSSVWQLPRSGHRSHLNFTDIKTKGKKCECKFADISNLSMSLTLILDHNKWYHLLLLFSPYEQVQLPGHLTRPRWRETRRTWTNLSPTKCRNSPCPKRT